MLDSQDMNEFSTKFNEILKKASSIAVVGHIQPDGDCIASTLVMQKYIQFMQPNKTVVVVLESKPINDWPFGDLNDQVIWTDNAVETTRGKDLIVFLDGNTSSRFTVSHDIFSAKYQVCLDHHSNPADQFELSVVDTSATSAVEVILNQFWDEKSPRVWLDEYYANIALYGILSDTGTFRFVDHQKARIFPLVQKLMEEFKISIITLDNYLNSYKPEQIEFIGTLLSRTKFVKDQTIQPYMYTYFELDDSKKYPPEITKPSVNSYKYTYLKQVEGYKWGFVISQTNRNDIDISFRSQPDSYDVNQIAMKLNGGGHPRAAAAHIPASSVSNREDVVKLIIQTVKEIYHAD